MKILDIYSKYNIPDFLIDHMLKVTAVSRVICDSIVISRIDSNLVSRVLLLHDIGNLVKIDLRRIESIVLNENLFDYWIRVKNEFIEKYGSDDHVASAKIAGELGLPQYEISLLSFDYFFEIDSVLKSQDWHLKICAYSDQRVAPFGVTTLRQRLEDVKDRYCQIPKYKNFDYDNLICLAEELESQIQSVCRIDLQSIDENSIKNYKSIVSNFEV
ncbi:MAG: hypothetical protein NZO16_01015 [Deltaproteobacteria bacterium]|nr:hypothetical protein [Deltaproteobacteria bacterium]